MTEEVLTGEIVKRDIRGRRITHGRAGILTGPQKLALKRDLALGTETVTELGKKYGMTKTGICQFRNRHALAIENIREHLENEFAGISIAEKKNRIAEYQEMFERLGNHQHADHHEWVKAQAIILRNTAEELGQLPPRQQITVIPVQHVVVGVETGDLT